MLGKLFSSAPWMAAVCLAAIAFFEWIFTNRILAFGPGSGLVVLIGGINSDPTREQIEGRASRGEGNSGLYQLRGDFLAQGIEAEYFNWNGTLAGNIKQKNPRTVESIVAQVRHWRQRNPLGAIAIIGNSWGGHTALDVCEKLRSAGYCERQSFSIISRAPRRKVA